MPTVGLVGVGNMGGAMAQRLLASGWGVRVCDLDPEKTAVLERFGAVAGTTPAHTAMDCVALIVCVVDGAQTHEVLFGAGGAAAALGAGQSVLLCPTLAPADVERIAARLAGRGIDTVDAPMSGGPARARDGTMSLMVACADAAFERARPLIETLSSRVFRVGSRCGDGARTKLVNNLLAGINLVGAAEALALAGRLGLDAAATLAVIEQSSGQSWIGSDRLHRALAGDLAPRAHVTLLQKDTRLALEAAAEVGFAAPLGAAARATFDRAAAAGMAGLDDAAIYTLLAGGEPAA